MLKATEYRKKYSVVSWADKENIRMNIRAATAEILNVYIIQY